MDDLSRRIREANPHVGESLPDHAVATLDDLLSGRRTPQWDRSGPPQTRQRARPLLLVSAAFVVSMVFVVVAAVILRPVSARALTPNPLEVQPTSMTVDALREGLVAIAPEPTSAPSRRGAEWEGWYVHLDADQSTDTFIQPQRAEIVWNADGSGSTRIVAGVPVAPDGTELVPPPVTAAATGETLYEDSWDPGEVPVVFPTDPPEDEIRMRKYLDAYLSEQGAPGPTGRLSGDYLVALETLMQVWTLGGTSQRAAIEVVIGSAGVSVAGVTRDRAGRPGLLIDTAPTDLDPGHRTRLVIDPDAGRILAVESITTEGLPDFNVPAGSVTDYTIWR